MYRNFFKKRTVSEIILTIIVLICLIAIVLFLLDVFDNSDKLYQEYLRGHDEGYYEGYEDGKNYGYDEGYKSGMSYTSSYIFGGMEEEDVVKWFEENKNAPDGIEY